MKSIVIAARALLLAAPALADQSLAFEFGGLLGSEKACNLDFDPAAIERYVAEKVEPSDMEFLSNMNLAADVMARDVERFTPSRRTAHCAQVRRVAESLDLVK